MEKYTVDNAREKAPKSIRKIVYDKDDRVLMGSRMTKGKVEYGYVPAEFMEKGVDFIVSTSISYDGKGNKNLPKNAEKMHFEDLHKRFTTNEF